MLGVDSSIIIDLLRGNSFKALEDEELWTSEIVVYELLIGMYASLPSKVHMLDEILDTFHHIIPFTRRESMKAAELQASCMKQGRIMQHTDALIAGSLIASGCTRFLTLNKKDFEKVPGLHIVPI
jgi:predicted nucleic acid-binding protein